MARQFGGASVSPQPADDRSSWLSYVGRQVGLFRLDSLLYAASHLAFFATKHPTSGGARTARVEQVQPGTLALRRAQIESTAALVHPDVPTTYLVDVMDEMLVVIMDPFEARPVLDAAPQMPLPPEQAIEVVSTMAATIDTVHARGFFHGRMWLRRDLTPVLFDFTPAPGPFAPPGLSREFQIGRLDWGPSVGAESSDRRAVDFVALEMVAWWLLTGRDGVDGAVGRGHALGTVAAALDRQFLSATELADAFATAVRRASLDQGGRTDQFAQAGWRPWPAAPIPPVAHDGPNGIGGVPTPPPLSNSPIFRPPLSNSPIFSAPLSNSPVFTPPPTAPHSFPPPGSSEAWPKTEPVAGTVKPKAISRLHFFFGDRRTLVATAGLVVLSVLVAVVTVTLQVVRTIDGAAASATPTSVAGLATSAPLIAPTAPAASQAQQPVAQSAIPPAATAPQGSLLAPPPSAAEIAETNAGQTILEAESLVAPTNPHPDPDQAVGKLDQLRANLSPTSPTRARVDDLETRILLDDAAKRTADAMVLKDRRILGEAGDRYQRARSIRPNDERVAPGLGKVQVTGWWLDFQDAFAEHDSDRQIVALQKVVQADPEFRSPEGPAKEKLVAALVGKAENAWTAGQSDVAFSLLDQAEQLAPDSPAVRDRRAMWFPTPTATVLAQATPRPIPTPVLQQPPQQIPRPPTSAPAVAPPTQAVVQPAPVPPTATRPAPPTATRVPPTPVPPPPTATRAPQATPTPLEVQAAPLPTNQPDKRPRR